MDDLELITLFDKRIRKMYDEQALVGLRFHHLGEPSFAPLGVDLFDKYYDNVREDPPLDEKELLEREALEKAGEKVEEIEYFDRKALFDELILLSDQIIYFTAHLYLFAPHMNNPLDDAVRLAGYENTLYPNYQNLAAKRFDFYSDTLAEKVYAFWMRLGHLLNRYLPEPLKVNSVDFTRVMDRITEKVPRYHTNLGYQWLKKFQDGEQKKLNEHRSIVVHHVTSGTTFSQNHLSSYTYSEMKELMDERFSRPDTFKKHLNLSLTALNKILDLIAEFPEPVPLRKYKPKRKPDAGQKA